MSTLSTDAGARSASVTARLAWLAPVARVLLASIFIISGAGKLADPAGAAAYIEYGGLPGILVWPTIALELLGGLMLAAGYHSRIVAAALAGFSLLAGLLFHYLPGSAAEGMERMMQMIHFQKNISIAGGLLLLAAVGPGAFAVNRR